VTSASSSCFGELATLEGNPVVNLLVIPPAARFASVALLASLAVAGCHGRSTTSASFTPSATATAPGLVKILEKSSSGPHVVLEVVIFGPERDIDLFAFEFAVKIGDPTLVRFVPQQTYTQTALTTADGQTIAIDMDGASERSLVQVHVTKEGGGAGNGISAAAALVIELTFEVQGARATTLTLVGQGADAPQALDSSRAAIAAVTFDPASAGVTGVTAGGGGY
jgi:hypothetical protein